MRKSEELTNPNSCMSRARDDEWTFVLLGRDKAAPVAVRAWIEERIRLGKNQRTDPQIIEAEQWMERVFAEQNFDTLNARRIELAEKKICMELQEQELNEFNQLQKVCFDFLNAKHPKISIDLKRLAEIEKRLEDKA